MSKIVSVATIPNGADHVNLGAFAGTYGTTHVEVPSDYNVYGGGYYPSANVNGWSAIYSGTSVSGITLSSQAGSRIEGGAGKAQTSADGAVGAGGIGVNLQVADTFINGGTVRGGGGGSPYSPTGLGGQGGAGVALSGGAYLDNGGTVDGGIGGGTIFSGGAGGSSLFTSFGPSGVGVEVAGGQVYNSGNITGGGYLKNNQEPGAAGVQLASGATGATANYLHNTGTITGGGGNGGGGSGVDLVAFNQVPLNQQGNARPGVIYNQGQITGGGSELGTGGDGVHVAANLGGATDLVNAGTIFGGAGVGGGGIGVNLVAADLAYNNQEGKIYGGNATGAGANGGTGLSDNGNSFFFSSGGFIQGGAGDGSGSGGAGAYVGDNSTLELFDTTVTGGTGGATGSAGDAIQFAQGSSGNLGIYGDDTFYGQVAGASSSGAYDTLTLYQSGTLSGGLGTQFTGFSQLAFSTGDPGWTVDTTLAAVTALNNVTGFATGDTLDVTDLPFGSLTDTFSLDSGSTTSGTLSITDSGGTYSIHFDYLPAGASFQLTSDGASGTDITLACFLRGTRIRTVRGDVAIETLSVGDRVICSSGDTRPVRWIGHRGIDCSGYPNPDSVWPVCIRAGALGEQQPARDLWVSPGHAVVVNGVLIQAEKLVNGVTVVRMPRARVQYWHVELDAHDILFAEGLATESYLDTGNRSAFLNGGAFLEAYPDFRPKHWRETCLPLVIDGPELKAARAVVIERAKELGYTITNDADVHVTADGERLEPLALGEKRVAFVVPAHREKIELRCRTFVPAHVDAASGDGRELGLCVGRLQIDGVDCELADDQRAAEGWHALETFASGHTQRWTTGCTPLPAGTRLIVVDTAGRSYCWQQPEQAVALCG